MWQSTTNGSSSGSFGDDVVDDEEEGVRTAFLVDSIVYALVGCIAAAQLVRNCGRYRPWTVQKMIHLLMFFATLGTSPLCARFVGS